MDLIVQETISNIKLEHDEDLDLEKTTGKKNEKEQNAAPTTSNSNSIRSSSVFSIDNINKEIKSDENFYQVFTSLIMDQLNVSDVKAILESQKQIIKLLDSTNSNLAKTNKHSSDTFHLYASKDYHSYINLLTTMKHDLDFIFKRIKLLKSKLQNKYPSEYKTAYETVQKARQQNLNSDEEDEDEEEFRVSNKINDTNPRKITILNEEYQNELKEANKLIDEGLLRNVAEQQQPPQGSNVNQTTSIIANLLLNARDRSKSFVSNVMNSASSKSSTPSPTPMHQADSAVN